MVGEIIHAVSKKYNGEYGTATTIFSLGNGETATATITIPIGMIAYIIEHGGYVNQADVLCEYRDTHGTMIYDWEEFPDTFKMFEDTPFTWKMHKTSIKYYFENTSGATATMLLIVNVLLVPEPKKDDFEAAIKDIAETNNLLREIRDTLKIGRVVI